MKNTFYYDAVNDCVLRESVLISHYEFESDWQPGDQTTFTDWLKERKNEYFKLHGYMFYDSQIEDVISEIDVIKCYLWLIKTEGIEESSIDDFISDCTGKNGNLTEIK